MAKGVDGLTVRRDFPSVSTLLGNLQHLVRYSAFLRARVRRFRSQTVVRRQKSVDRPLPTPTLTHDQYTISREERN